MSIGRRRAVTESPEGATFLSMLDCKEGRKYTRTSSMQRKPLFMVAAVAEAARFLLLFFLARAGGETDESAGFLSFFRYAASGQLFFVFGFFFLWYDRSRHDGYRSLLFAGKIVSLATFVPLAIAMAGSIRAGKPADGSSILFALAIFGVDIYGFCLLLVSRPFGGPVGQGPALRSPPGQGPDDIERVESL